MNRVLKIIGSSLLIVMILGVLWKYRSGTPLSSDNSINRDPTKVLVNKPGTRRLQVPLDEWSIEDPPSHPNPIGNFLKEYYPCTEGTELKAARVTSRVRGMEEVDATPGTWAFWCEKNGSFHGPLTIADPVSNFVVVPYKDGMPFGVGVTLETDEIHFNKVYMSGKALDPQEEDKRDLIIPREILLWDFQSMPYGVQNASDFEWEKFVNARKQRKKQYDGITSNDIRYLDYFEFRHLPSDHFENH